MGQQEEMESPEIQNLARLQFIRDMASKLPRHIFEAQRNVIENCFVTPRKKKTLPLEEQKKEEKPETFDEEFQNLLERLEDEDEFDIEDKEQESSSKQDLMFSMDSEEEKFIADDICISDEDDGGASGPS